MQKLMIRRFFRGKRIRLQSIEPKKKLKRKTCIDIDGNILTKDYLNSEWYQLISDPDVQDVRVKLGNYFDVDLGFHIISR